MSAAPAEPDSPMATLARKVEYLSRPESYSDGATAVEIVETHMSFVFLTGHYVYKLKKPVHHPFLDFTSLQARRFNCEEEVRLNRRLARNVYLGVVALTLDAGDLRLDGEGQVVEWLVKMRRLPRHLMLDRAIQEARATEQDVARFTRVLAAFYRDAEPVRIAAEAYRERLRTAILANDAALSAPHFGLDRAALKALADAQLAFIEHAAPELDERIRQERIVEGHGDLRPEHVCLAAEPVFIDCLEFNRDLRLLDPVDELAYLAMECELAGALWIGRVVFDTYCNVTGDTPSVALIGFYQGLRATLRAKLAAWHLEDGITQNMRTRWLTRAQAYLDLAALCCERAATATGKGPAIPP